MNIIIVHGAFGSPEENWFPWLKGELEKLGHAVHVPRFPTPENQTLDKWLEAFQNYRQYLDEDTILVGHSLGPAFILNLLERLDRPIRAAFLVAGFTGRLGLEEFDPINRTFCERNFNWEKIKQNCKSFFVFSSDNDPYVPLEKGKELAENLGAELTVVEGAGHFNEKAGYKEFPLLLEKIRRLL
jgi:predicted alpha/beta hydrolase family esterase